MFPISIPVKFNLALEYINNPTKRVALVAFIKGRQGRFFRDGDEVQKAFECMRKALSHNLIKDGIEEIFEQKGANLVLIPSFFDEIFGRSKDIKTIYYHDLPELAYSAQEKATIKRHLNSCISGCGPVSDWVQLACLFGRIKWDSEENSERELEETYHKINSIAHQCAVLAWMICIIRRVCL